MKFLAACFAFMPPAMKPRLRVPFDVFMGFFERACGACDEFTPPRRLRARFTSSVSIPDFKAAGRIYLGLFRELCALEPGEAVLEVGSGCGRIAAALTDYIVLPGRYDGLEISEPGVEWCRSAITARFPCFNFHFADVFNRHYNPRGRHEARNYRFPFPDEAFDFVFLGSVFTHMLPDEVKHYLLEISRVLKRGGRCFATYFLWNRETSGLCRSGKSDFGFRVDCGLYRTQNRSVPEVAVCYPENWIMGLYAEAGLTVKNPPLFGTWRGKPGRFGQDVIIGWKE